MAPKQNISKPVSASVVSTAAKNKRSNGDSYGTNRADTKRRKGDDGSPIAPDNSSDKSLQGVKRQMAMDDNNNSSPLAPAVPAKKTKSASSPTSSIIKVTIEGDGQDPNADISIDNVVSTANFKRKLSKDNMYRINSQCWNVTWNEGKSKPHVKGTPGNALTMGIRDETNGRSIRASVAIYGSGKIVCRGAKSVADSKRAVRICGRHVQKVLKESDTRLGLRPIQVFDFKVVNIAAHLKTNGNFDMKGVTDQLKVEARRNCKVEWPFENPNSETDGLATAKYSEENVQRLKSKRGAIQSTTAMLQQNGHVSIMGAKDMDSLYRICNKIKTAIQQNQVVKAIK